MFVDEMKGGLNIYGASHEIRCQEISARDIYYHIAIAKSDCNGKIYHSPLEVYCFSGKMIWNAEPSPSVDSA
jgi:hypothetical protein